MKLIKKIKAAPKLISFVPLHIFGERAKTLMEEASGRADVPDLPNLPRHLKDYVPNFRTTKSGGSMAGIATVEDFEGLTASPASVLFVFLAVLFSYFFIGLLRVFSGFSVEQVLGGVGVALLLGSIFYSFLGGSPRKAVCVGAFALFLSALGFGSLLLKYLPIPQEYLVYPLFFSASLVPWVWSALQERTRGHKLIFQSRKNGGGKAILRIQGAHERMSQAKQAIKEANLPHVLFGQTLGVLSRNVLSPWACDPGLPLKASIPTMSLHTHVFGSSGAGKSKFLLGLISQLYESRGMFISDFKAALPYEARIALHTLITPKEVCNMLHEVDPSDFYTFLTGAKKVDAGANSIFQDNGFKIILAQHILLKAATDKIKKSTNGKTTKISLCDSSSKRDEFSMNIGGLFRLIQLSRIQENRKSYLDQLVNLLEFEIEEESKKGHGQLSAAIKEIDGYVKHADQELIANFYSNAITVFDDFFSSNELRDWSESEIPPVDFEKCFTEKLRVGIAIGDIQGATGIFYLAMFHQRFKKIAKRLAQEVSATKERLTKACAEEFEELLDATTNKVINRFEEDINSVLYVIDECASVFQFDKSDGLGDEQMVSIFRSLKVECVFACQSASQLIGRFSEAKMNAFFSNIATLVAFDTKEPATYQLIASRVGRRPRIKRQNSNTTSIDFAETYNQKAADSIYDLKNPNRDAMLSLTGLMGVKSGYAWGKIEVPEYSIVTQSIDSNSTELALDQETYTRWIQSPRVAFASVYVSGGYRQDFIKPYAVDENFTPFEIVGNETDKNLEIAKYLEESEKARKHIEVGDYFAAARVVEEEI